MARSGLIEHYKTEREGADRIENLEELVDAPSGKAPFTADGGAPDRSGRGASMPLTALPHSCRARGGRAPGGRGPGRAAADDGALGEGPGVRRGVPHRPGGRALPARAERGRSATGSRRSGASTYVAITRARNRLYLSHAQTRMLHGQTRYNIPSRFLEEIPERPDEVADAAAFEEESVQPGFSTPDAGRHGIRGNRTRDNGERISHRPERHACRSSAPA